MGLEPFLIASALRLVVAQRLLRRLCPKCRKPPAKGAKDETGEWTAEGCEHCHGTGYKGRTGVFETLWVTEELEELISKRTSARDLRAAGRRGGLVSLREAALASVRKGETSMAEAIEHTMESETDVRQEVSHA
jgi:type II secretory ATPase GspE/PulE/Tfp pilus assembly ATPase PilB-like protein